MIGIAGAWLFFAVIIVGLVASILPTIADSVMSMIRSFPDAVNKEAIYRAEQEENGEKRATKKNSQLK